MKKTVEEVGSFLHQLTWEISGGNETHSASLTSRLREAFQTYAVWRVTTMIEPSPIIWGRWVLNQMGDPPPPQSLLSKGMKKESNMPFINAEKYDFHVSI